MKEPERWTWEEFLKLPAEDYVADIHCVTKWSKLDTEWEGVSVDTLLLRRSSWTQSRVLTAFCDGGYTTNLPSPMSSTARPSSPTVRR